MLAVPYMATGPLAAVALRLSLADILFLRGGEKPAEVPASDGV
jgi:hypothetical protein